MDYIYCRTYYITYAIKKSPNISFSELYKLSSIWVNILCFGCTYSSTLEEKCWNHCPSKLKNSTKYIYTNEINEEIKYLLKK